jgi:hypothetical protein
VLWSLWLPGGLLLDKPKQNQFTYPKSSIAQYDKLRGLVVQDLGSLWMTIKMPRDVCLEDPFGVGFLLCYTLQTHEVRSRSVQVLTYE